MIEFFEQYTHELTEYELKTLLPLLTKLLEQREGAKKAIRSRDIVWHFQGLKDPQGQAHMISGARVRKLVNHIRNNGLIEGLIATSKGYYITRDPLELAKYLDTLKARAGAILRVKDNMKPYLEKMLTDAA